MCPCFLNNITCVVTAFFHWYEMTTVMPGSCYGWFCIETTHWTFQCCTLFNILTMQLQVEHPHKLQCTCKQIYITGQFHIFGVAVFRKQRVCFFLLLVNAFLRNILIYKVYFVLVSVHKPVKLILFLCGFFVPNVWHGTWTLKLWSP